MGNRSGKNWHGRFLRRRTSGRRDRHAFNHRAYDPIDDIDKISCRPDFGIMLYSGYSCSTAACHRQSARNQPRRPLFLVHAFDDKISAVDNTITMYMAMKKAGVSVRDAPVRNRRTRLRRPQGRPSCETWTDRCVEWLRNLGL